MILISCVTWVSQASSAKAADGVGGPGTGGPGTGGPGTGGPGTGGPGTGGPGTGGPGTGGPGTGGPGTGGPGTGGPGTGGPGTGGPGTGGPGTGGPGTGGPGTGGPGTGGPGTGDPGMMGGPGMGDPGMMGGPGMGDMISFGTPSQQHQVKPVKKTYGYSTGGAMWKEYNCGETNSETDKVLDSIEGFQKMLGSIKDKGVCSQIEESLRTAIPGIRDITTAMTNSATAQAIKRQKQELRDIELALGAGGNPQSLGMLMQRKQFLQVQISQMEARFAVVEEVQTLKQYETAVQNTDDYFSKVTQAFNQNCFQDDRTKTQAMLSLTGIAGLVAGASPLGAGLSAVSKLVSHLQGIEDPYSTKELDDFSLYAGLKCALRNMQSQHCEMVKTNQLFRQQETEAGSCDQCTEESFYNDITAVKSIITSVTEATQEPSENPTQFVQRFLDENNSYEKALENLQAFTQNMDKEFLQEAAMGSRQECRTLGKNHYKCIVLDKSSAQAAIEKINQAYLMINQRGFRSTAASHQQFVSVMREAFSPANLENLAHLMTAYTDYQQRAIHDYRASSGNPAPNADFLRYMTHFTIEDLFDLSSSLLPSQKFQKYNDMTDAYAGSDSLQESFSKIFTSHALQALKTVEQDIEDHSGKPLAEANRNRKNIMCINLIGLKDLSNSRGGAAKRASRAQDKIKDKCKSANITLKDSNGVEHTLNYADYTGADFEDRVCVFQNFLNCMDFPSEDSPACLAYKNAQQKTDN